MKILQSIGLRRFFALVTILLAGISMICSALLIRSSTRLYKNTLLMGEAVESIHIAEQLEIKILIHNRESFLWQTTAGGEHKREREHEKTALYELLRQSKKFIGTPAEREIINRLEDHIGNYFRVLKQLEASNASALEIYHRISPLLNSAFLLTDELVRLNLQQSRNFMKKTYEEEKMANIAGISIAILVFVVVASLLLMVRRFLYTPIVKLRDTINRFSPSDFTVKAVENGPKEIREIAMTFNGMAKRLVKQRELQYRFLAAVVHDLKNPIGAIALSSEVLERQEDMSQAKALAKVISRQARQLNRMVGDLLDSARIEAGKLELQKKDEDIVSIIKDAIELYKSTSSIHKISLDSPYEKVYCLIDPVRISQVIQNLLSNAIKYSPDGGNIQISINRENRQVIVAVSDSGIGIKEEEQKQIFEPFQRTTYTRESIPGVGLGLSVSKRIVEAHGGCIRLKSYFQQGSTFFVQLPC